MHFNNAHFISRVTGLLPFQITYKPPKNSKHSFWSIGHLVFAHTFALDKSEVSTDIIETENNFITGYLIAKCEK